MIANYALILAIAFVPVVISQQSISVRECIQPWSRQYQCLTSSIQRRSRSDSTFPIPDWGGQNRARNQVNNCFKKYRCRTSPFPNDQEQKVRRDCLRQAKDELDRELRQCVERGGLFISKINHWQPPRDDPEQELEDWTYAVTRVDNALKNPWQYCDQPRNLKRGQSVGEALEECVAKQARYDFHQRPPRGQPSYWCEEDARCWSDLSSNCQRLWEDKCQPSLCQCSRKVNLRAAQEGYKQCFDRGIRDRDRPLTNDDPAPEWLSDYLRDYCQNKNNHPCKRQRQEQVRFRG